jgi:hypothetical protein
MSTTFCAFSPDQIEAMLNDPSQIDTNVYGEHFEFSACVESAWHVLIEILDGTGFYCGEQVEDVLSTGAFVVAADEVKQEAQTLSGWTHDKVLAGLRGIDEDADLYHLHIYKENEALLLSAFDELVKFYQRAAVVNLGVLLYVG